MESLEQRDAGPLGDLAVIDDGDVATETLGLLQIMGREDDGRPAGVELAQEGPHRAADLDVHARGRLVEDQQPRLVHQRPRDHQAPFEAAGELAHLGVAPVPEIELLEITLGTDLGLATRDAVVAGLIDHHLDNRQEEIEVELLRHQADEGLDQLGRAILVLAEDPHAPAGLVHQRGEDPDEGRFTRPVRSQQRKEIPCPRRSGRSPSGPGIRPCRSW
jgi:hypothetical protein